MVESHDLSAIRARLIDCLRVDRRSHSSALADMQTIRAKGDLKLKPARGQAMHATATRPAGRSRELIGRDFEKARLVRAKHSLQSLHITALDARYSPSRQTRKDAAERLSHRVSMDSKQDVRAAARCIALAMLQPSRQSLRQMCNIGVDEWRASPTRRLCDTVSRQLKDRDEAALIAWDRECEKTC